MKLNWLFLGLFVFLMNCDRNEESRENIELDQANWEYSQKSSLILKGGTSEHHDIYIKIDGKDGSYLYLVVPNAYLNSVPALPHDFNGRAAYYPNSTVQTDVPFEGTATIQLLEMDALKQQFRLVFDAVVYEKIAAGQDSVARHFSSDEISAIDFREVNTVASSSGFEIKKGQEIWNVSEIYTGMRFSQVNWNIFNNEVIGEPSSFYLTIPWSHALGTIQIDPANNSHIGYRIGNSFWILESAELTLEENSFHDAKQKGRFKAVFHDPNFPDQKFQVTEGRFDGPF